VVALCRALDGPWYRPLIKSFNRGVLSSCAAFGVATGSFDTVCDNSRDDRKEAFSASSCSILELEGLNAFSLGRNLAILAASSRVTFYWFLARRKCIHDRERYISCT